jgi:hypothetical protein
MTFPLLPILRIIFYFTRMPILRLPSHNAAECKIPGTAYFSIFSSSISMSSKILKTYLAGQSATDPDKATETATASNIS